MKRIMFVALALLLGLALWTIKVGWAQKSNTDNVGQRQQKNLFEINTWGTLKVVRNKEGKEIFGPRTPPNEGYSIAYQRLDPKTKKPMEAPKVFFAVGDQFSEDQLICEECEEYKMRLQEEYKKRLQEDQAIATVTTKDGVLRVSSNFYFIEKEGRLKIVRIIENISKYPVQLISIRAQYDARLIPDKTTQFGKVIKSDKPNKNDQTQPKLTPSNSFVPGSWTTAAPLLHPTCDPCPPYCDLELKPSQGERELICVECPEDGSSVLEYMTHKVKMGEDLQAIITKLKADRECEHSIVVDVWNGCLAVEDKSEPLGRGDVICVDCPKKGVETFIVQPVSTLGNVMDPIKMLRDSGLCQLAIYVNNGSPGPANPNGNNDCLLGPRQQLASVENFYPR